MINNFQSRRSFIKRSALAAAGFTIIPNLISRAAISDRVRVAHIGLGGMGNQHMRWFAGLPDADIVALCDLDPSHLNQTAEKLLGIKPELRFDRYDDFRRVLDRKDIDAVTVATPDHWHAQIAMLAFEAGKDVYGEKPLSYDVWEGQQMLKSARRHNRIFQLGTQIHAGDNYHRVVELIKGGAIGKVHTVRLWRNDFSPGLGNPQIQPAPAYWDMWQGPAPERAYFPERCHFTYRYFLDYSGGVFADFWCHIADVVWWSLNPQGLTSVYATGEKTGEVADAPKWLNADFEFEGLKIHWTTKPPQVPGAEGKWIGAYFEGEKGTLLCDYDSRSITINQETVSDLKEIPVSISRSPGHQQNFIDAVRSRQLPESNLAYARKMTMPMHLALISWQLGEKLTWHSEKEKFTNNNKANEFLQRTYRQKWNLIG